MTAPTEDLIERLERHIVMSPQGDGATRLYRNPDGPAAAQALRGLQQEVVRLRGALEPFGVVGHIIDGPFGPVLFAKDDMAFQSGCAWRENGVDRKLTWGDFRAARSALTGSAD